MRDGNFTGLPGIPNHDIAMWESMSKISDRTSEWLGPSDIAVIQFRRMLLDAVNKFSAGHGTIGQGAPHLPQGTLRSYKGIVAKIDDWRTLGASDEEKAYLDSMEPGRWRRPPSRPRLLPPAE